MEIFLLLIVLGFLVCAGIGFMMVCIWIVRAFAGAGAERTAPPSANKCENCGGEFSAGDTFCPHCGWAVGATGAAREQLRDLAATRRQVERFHESGRIDPAIRENLIEVIKVEYAALTASQRGKKARHTTAAPADVVVADEGTPHVYAAASAAPFAAEHFEQATADADVYTADADVYAPARAVTYTAPRAEDAPPSKPFSEVFASFMEERNIRWGELVGGLLIVGCSVALVVSLWTQIAQLPVVKFLVFTSVTAALFGTGLYTEHRWKLPMTSRGLLLISVLLVPLNLLAVAAASASARAFDPLVIMSEAVAPIIFLLLVYHAGRVLVPSSPHLLACGVLGSSVCQLLVRHFAAPDTPAPVLFALGFAPLAIFAGTTLLLLRNMESIATRRARKAEREARNGAAHFADGEATRGVSAPQNVSTRNEVSPPLDERAVNEIFVAFGASLFAALIPCALLLFKTGLSSGVTATLAPLAALAGLPALLVGLTLRRDAHGERTRIAQTIGISLAIFGTLVMHAGFLLAFPQPGSLLIIAAAIAILLTLVARRFEIEILHLPAAACFVIAALLGFHLATGRLAWAMTDVVRLMDALVSPATGQMLTGLFVLLLAGAERFAVNQKLARRSYYIVAGAVAAVSLTLLTSFGFGVAGDPFHVAIAYGVYAAGALWCAWREELPALTWAASALALAAFAQTFGAWFVIPYASQTALLAHASLSFALGIFVRERGELLPSEVSKRIVLLDAPLILSAVFTSALAAVLIIFFPEGSAVSVTRAVLIIWLAAVWLAVALLENRRVFFWLFQGAVALAVTVGVAIGLLRFAWYVESGRDAWLHPWSLQTQGAALVLLSLAWFVVRLVTRQKQSGADGATGASGVMGASGDTQTLAARAFRAWREFTGARWSVDRATTGAVLACFVTFALIGVTPGVSLELITNRWSSASWDVSNAPHGLIGGAGAWVVFVLLLIVLLANARERFHRAFVYAVILLAASACPLLAMRWEAAMLTASVWRWCAVGLLAAGALFSWTSGAEKLARQVEPKTEIGGARDGELPYRARLMLLMLTAAPVIFLTLMRIGFLFTRLPQLASNDGGSFIPLTSSTISYAVPLILTGVVLAGFAVRDRAIGFFYAASLMLNLAASFWWLNERWHLAATASPRAQFVLVNVIACAVAGFVWLLWLERRYTRHGEIRNEQSGALGNTLPPFHHAAIVGSTVAVLCVVAFGLWADALGTGFASNAWLGWAALVATVVLALCSLSNVTARWVTPILYALGAIACGMALDNLNLAPRWFGLWGMTTLAAYGVATSYAWRRRAKLAAFLNNSNQAGISQTNEAQTGDKATRLRAGWLLVMNPLLACIVVALGLWVDFTFAETWCRLLAAAAVGSGVLTVGLLAAEKTTKLDSLALAVGAFAALVFGWAWLDPRTLAADAAIESNRAQLHYGVTALVALCVVAVSYGTLARRLNSSNLWANAARGVLPFTIAASGITLGGVLAGEALGVAANGLVSMYPAAILTVACVLLAASAACVVFALNADLDPLGLDDAGRMRYVYAAEILLALELMHIRLTMPYLFTGFFSRYWSLVIVVLAFVGVGLSEVFRRQQRLVLAQPLERTGAVLPLLPVLGFWVANTEVHFGGLLFLISLLYGVLSVMRRSFAFALLAALAGNGGLWYVLDHTRGFGFGEHPQVWLIPAALSVLVASYINRERLSAEQTTVIRYSTMMVIYVSSTFDIFLNGVATSPWLPLVLGALATGGVLAGIALRIRAFLFLGTTFLCVALVTIIWHASVSFGWTWLWYVAGIALGAGIILMFALFEKKRQDVLRIVDELKRWES